MVTLKGKDVFLRALEPEDIDFVYEIENDESIWEISNTITPYSRYLLKEYFMPGPRESIHSLCPS